MWGSKPQTKRTWRNLCQDKRCSFRAWKYRSRLYITCKNAMNEITQFAPAKWQNVSQCFSVEGWIGIQNKHRSFHQTHWGPVHNRLGNPETKMLKEMATESKARKSWCLVTSWHPAATLIRKQTNAMPFRAVFTWTSKIIHSWFGFTLKSYTRLA